MKIVIKVKDGENICCNGISSESVKELKARIQEKERILVHQYKIIFNGENLKDERLLSDYGIQDGSILLLVNKEKSLLLKHSIIFDNSDLVDRIHQSIIDLKKCSHIDDVLDLLNEAISYLDEDLKPHVAIELFFLIISCSLKYSDQSLQLFNKRLQKGSIKSNHIISFAKVLSNIFMNFPQISNKNYDDFILNSFQQISQQILKSPDNNLIILENEIPSQFKNCFITDIILLFNPTEQIVKNFSPFIINSKNFDLDIINFFIKKVNESGLLNIITDSLLIKSDIYTFLTIENRELIIQSSTEQTFRNFLPLIESELNNFFLTSSYCNTILNKLIEYDISLNSEFNNFLFEKVDDIKLDSKNLEYLKRHKIKLPDKFISKIVLLPISLENIELFCNAEKIPKDHLKNILYNANDLKIYNKLLLSQKLMTDVFTKLDFWKHILTIVSSTKDKIDDCCISQFSFYFQLNSSTQKEKIFDGLIFDEHLPNERQSNFLLKLFTKIYGTNFERFLFIGKRERYQKLLTYNEIPVKSLCKLFYCPDLLNENTTTKEFYFFIFSFHKFETIPQCSYDIFGSNFFSINKIKSIFNKNDDLLLTQFIKNKNDFSLISQFDEKTFSLVVASLAFGNYSDSITINGLNKENALPFYAIAINEKKYNYNILTHSSKKMLNAFTSSIIYSSDCNSTLLNESINSILSIGPDLLLKYNQSSFIFDILCDHLIQRKYKADKLLLFKFIFYISQLKIVFFVELYLDKIVQYGIRLFNIIFQNKTDIINSQLLDISLLDLNVFDSNEIKNYIENEFHKFDSDDDEIFQIILFYSKYCKNQPILNIVDITADGITRLFMQKIIDQKWDDFIQIIKFMSHNKMNINYDLLKDKQIPLNVSHALLSYSSYYNDIENYLNQCLHNPEFENEHSILFQILLQNKSIVYKYIVASIEKLYPNTYIYTRREIFRAKPYLSNRFQNDLLFVLNHLYSFEKKSFFLVKKLNVKQPELPDIDYSIIDKLIQLKKFDCLHYIASCFPFLFENDIIKIVDLVLPALNCLSFIYDETFIEDDLKIAISALSFLYSCLQSTKFISTFIVWLFENIESLTNSQIVCMSRILIALYNTDTINKIICGYALKYNLFDKLSNLLTRDVSNEKFRPIYFDNLFQLFNIQLEFILKQTNNIYNYSLINQISNGSLSNPFDINFNFYSVIPIDFQKISFSFQIKNTSTELLDNYINRINESKIYWLSDKQSVISDQYNSNFLKNIEDKQYDFIYDKLPRIKPSSTKIIPYLISQPKWAFDLITCNDYFPVLPEHYSLLNEIIKNAPIDEENENDDIELIKALENDVFVKKIIKSFLKKYLYSEITSYKKAYFQLSLYKITCKNIFIESIMDILLEIETPPTFKLFYTNLSKLLCTLIEEDVDINVTNKFFEKVGTKLINIFLSPYLIDEVFFTSRFLTLFNCNLPIQTIHLIEHLIYKDPSNISLAFQLYSKIENEKEKEKNLPSITEIYLEKMKSSDLDYKIFCLFFKEFYNDEQNLIYQLKQLAEKNSSLCADCLSIFIHKYMKYDDQTLGDLIIIFFNILAPERKNYQGKSSQESEEIDFTQSCEVKIDEKDDFDDYDDEYIRLGKATENFYYNNVNFWQNVYEKHRYFLCFFSVRNENNFEKLTFLHDYYELVPFEYRLSYFKKKTSQLLYSRPYNSFVIKVNRSNILENTFNQLNYKDPRDLIGYIRVIFENEIGVDEGGLTNEWFSLITKELLNPEYGLFISNENNCYHPNKLSYFNSKHIDYFKLAGKIVALALLNNQNINAHFSIAFYRQILHQRIKLKDLENFDHSLFNSLKDILNVDDIKVLDLVFSIDDDVFGKATSIDLIENGENIQVNNDNRMNYVSLYANYKLRKSVIDQINAFCNAFDEIIPHELINIFSPSELDLMICGVPQINLDDMKNHTHYQMPYHDEHPTIVMLFNVLKKFTQEDLAKFLVFLTGSSQVPVGGFKIFEDSGRPITIIYNKNIDRLPVAHTCFRALDLPCYDDENVLRNKLLRAINECDDFGLV